MTQLQLDMICKIIENGAPVLAVELKEALSNFVQSYNRLVEENKELRAQLTSEEAELDTKAD